ncbi:uncharacterized protein [Diabrotica undecimpunctata]|uniref:uncharacterized protein n=1 Tax=Diabrotica undecimpunctata TaxID=50387 RepID=UPI003B63AC12
MPTTNNLNGSSQDQATKELGPSVRICHLNIEGISRSKCEYLQKVLIENNIDVIAIQETHVENEEQILARGRIRGYDLLGATYHPAYGVATYVRNKIENAHVCSTSDINNIHTVTIQIGEITISNIYKPPAVLWPPHVIHAHPHPSVYVGDFNSHHELWKYRQSDQNGEALLNWSEEVDTYLVFDAKDQGTFRSAVWKREYNPDLCFVSTNEKNQPLATSRTVLPDFPHSQHRPVVIEVGIKIPIITSFSRPRWNFKKADWTTFTERLDKSLGWITPTRENYIRFVGAVISTVKKTIPRGYRKEKLGSSRHTTRDKVPIVPKRVASHIVATSRAPRDRDHTTKVKQELKILKSECPLTSQYSEGFTLEEINSAISEVKSGKAPGFDKIHPEFLLHCGKYARKWLVDFYTDMIKSGEIPHSSKRASIIAILKPGKANDQPQNYRPIALLSCVYKLLERLIYNRIIVLFMENHIDAILFAEMMFP